MKTGSERTGVIIGLCLILLSVVFVEKTHVSNGWLVSSKSVFGLLPYSTKRIAQLDKVTNVIVRCTTGVSDGTPIDTYDLYFETSDHNTILLPSSVFDTSSSKKAEALKAALQQSLNPSDLHRWGFIMWPLGIVGAFLSLTC